MSGSMLTMIDIGLLRQIERDEKFQRRCIME